MEEQIQTLLDAQWDALASRDKGIAEIRTQLAAALGQIASQRAVDIDELSAKIDSSSKTLQRIANANRRRDELENKLEVEKQSPLVAEVETLSQKITSIDKQIASLQEARRDLDSQRQELQSTLRSRTAIHNDAIADLEKSCPKHLRDSEGHLKAALEESRQERQQFELERRAAYDGQQLWLSVCKHLNNLDREIRGLKRSQLPQMSFILARAASDVEASLESASEQKWSPLEIAIGHELQILHETLAAVQAAGSGKSD